MLAHGLRAAMRRPVRRARTEPDKRGPPDLSRFLRTCNVAEARPIAPSAGSVRTPASGLTRLLLQKVADDAAVLVDMPGVSTLVRFFVTGPARSHPRHDQILHGCGSAEQLAVSRPATRRCWPDRVVRALPLETVDRPVITGWRGSDRHQRCVMRHCGGSRPGSTTVEPERWLNQPLIHAESCATRQDSSPLVGAGHRSCRKPPAPAPAAAAQAIGEEEARKNLFIACLRLSKTRARD